MNPDPEVRQTEPELDNEYFDASEQMPPHAILSQLEPYLGLSGTAMDLGAGVGTASHWLSDHGYSVTAVDSLHEAIVRLNRRFAVNPLVDVVEADFSKITLFESDVIVAGFSLFFVPKWRFKGTWKSISNALKPGGLFAGQFLGRKDEWNDGKRTIHSAQTLKNLLKDFEILYWEEVDREGKTIINKTKHWHIFHVVAKKK
jgi:SAM-dependent methyltransferase